MMACQLLRRLKVGNCSWCNLVAGYEKYCITDTAAGIRSGNRYLAGYRAIIYCRVNCTADMLERFF